MNKKIPVVIAAIAMAALIPISGLAYEMVKKEGTVHEHKNSIEADMDKNGVPDKVTLVKVPKRDFADYDIVKDASLRLEEKGRVITAPLNHDILYKSSGLESVTIADNVNPFIAVSCSVPRVEDDWAVTLYSFDGKAITEQLRVTSNEPSIEITDVDNDGVKDMVVIDRDYANNSETDKFLTTYRYTDNKWQRASVYRTKTKELTKSNPE